MHVQQIEKHLYLIDTEVAGIKSFIASYVLKGKQAALIETGPTSATSNLLLALEKLGIQREEVAYVAVSHIHLDHGGGIGTLLKNLPKAKAVVHPRGAPHLVDPEKLWQQSQTVLGQITNLYGKPESAPQEKIIAATDGMILDLGNKVKLKVIETVGHASHHQSFFDPLSQGVFPGDAAGVYLNEIDVIVPTTPPPFRLDMALAALEKLRSLKPKVLYYSHFGRADNAIEKLQAYENQIKLWAKAAKQGVENHETLEEIRQRILRSDPAVEKAEEFIKAHPVLNDTTLVESVQGFVDFVQKYSLPF